MSPTFEEAVFLMKNCMERRGKREITFRTCDFYPCPLTLGKCLTVCFVNDPKERKIIYALSIDKLRIEVHGVLD